MTTFSKSFLFSTVMTGLLACQAPNASDTANPENNDASSNTSASVDVGVDVGGSGTGDASNASGNTSSSTSANSELTISVKGNTYTYGQIKSYYQCVAANSPNTSFK